MNNVDKYLRAIRRVALGGVAGIILSHTLPHVYPAKFSASIQTLSCEGIEQHHVDMLSQTCRDMGIDPEKIELQYRSGLSAFSVGSLYFKNNPIVGLPRTVTFKDKETVTNLITFENSHIDKEASRVMFNSFSLTDEELKFVFAHEIVHIRDQHFSGKMVHSLATLYSFYRMGTFFPHFLKKPPALSKVIAINLFFWTLGYLFHYKTSKLLSHYFEFEADRKAISLGENYRAGAISYSQKRLALNLQIKRLNGDSGESMFTEEGDRLNDHSHPARSKRLQKIQTYPILQQ